MSVEGEIRQAVHDLPLVSRSMFRVLEVVSDERHSAADVVRIVECDGALTAEILRAVNSAAYAHLGEVTSVVRAVALLGDAVVAALAVRTCSAKIMERELRGYDSARGEMWAHALRTAIAARRISVYARTPVDKAAAYTAGLMHDIGKIVVSNFLEKNKGAVRRGEAHGDFLEIERRAIGITHERAGAILAGEWGLPEGIRQAIEHHHGPAAARAADRPLVYVVHLGDAVAMMGGAGTGADTLDYSLDGDYPEYVAVDRERLALTMLDVEEEFELACRSIFGRPHPEVKP